MDLLETPSPNLEPDQDAFEPWFSDLRPGRGAFMPWLSNLKPDPGNHCTVCRYSRTLWRIDLANLPQSREDCKFCDILFNGIVFHQPEKKSALDLIRDLDGKHAPSTLKLDENENGTLDVAWMNWYWSQPPWSLPDPKPPSFLLQFYTDFESSQRNPWPALRHATYIPQGAFADSCWTLVSNWIHKCYTEHDSCPSNESTVLPTRYLEISDSGDTAYPSVRLCENDTCRKGKFAALSHVWQASKPINTTTDNINKMKQGIPYQDLPKTFQHAVSICEKLGLKFLWVDSICIIQDDDEDWQTQASKMSDVYAESYLTIAAHPTENMYGGLDAEADNGCHLSRARIFETTVPGTDGGPFSVFARKTHNHEQFVATTFDEGRSSYFKRGWCFQERMLAPRILHCMESEFVFECNHGMECECGSVKRYAKSGLRRIHAHLKPLLEKVRRQINNPEVPDTNLEVWKAYNRIIEDYAEGGLTKPTDLLPALSSVASLMSPVLGEYFAGIWEFNLVHGLQWESNWRRMDKRNECHRHPSEKYVAPSFSWASRRGGVNFLTPHDWTNDSSKYGYAEIRRIECKRRGLNRFGEVTDGSLTLFACRIPMKYIGQDGPLEWMIKLTGDTIEECTFTLDAIEDKDLAKEKEISCIELKRARTTDQGEDSDTVHAGGIVAVPSDHTPGAYQRIGFVHYRRRMEELPLSDYTIV